LLAQAAKGGGKRIRPLAPARDHFTVIIVQQFAAIALFGVNLFYADELRSLSSLCA